MISEEDDKAISDMMDMIGQLSKDLHEALVRHPLNLDGGDIMEFTWGPMRIVLIDRRYYERYSEGEEE